MNSTPTWLVLATVLATSGCVAVDAPAVVHSGWVDEVCRATRLAQFDGDLAAIDVAEAVATSGFEGVDAARLERVLGDYEAAVRSVAEVVPPEDADLYGAFDEAASALVLAGRELAQDGQDVEQTLGEYQLALARHRASLGEIQRTTVATAGGASPRDTTIQRLADCPAEGTEPCRTQLRYVAGEYRCDDAGGSGADDG